MTKLIQPLSTMVPIVDDDGKPTAQFARTLQRLAVSSNLSVTNGKIDVAAIATHMILANKTAGSATPTACSISDILDFLTTTRGSILFRGASGWQALAPGTANNILQTNGPGADPTWVTPSGGGGSFAFINQVALSGTAASIDFSSIPSTYENLIVEFMGRGTNASTTIIVNMRFNADSAANYDFYRYEMFHDPTSGSGMTFSESLAQTSAYVGQIPGSTAGANRAGAISIHIPNYARTVFYKKLRAQMASSLGVASFTEGLGWYDGEWRNTVAINEITLIPSAGSFAIGTVATLWGIKNS